MPVAGAELWIERVKWGGRPHYAHAGWFSHEDEHGWWVDLRVGDPVHRGEVVVGHGRWAGRMLFPEHGRWWAWFPDHHPELDLYCDIVREGRRHAGGVWAIDMDLDVIRYRAHGRAEIVDEDELEQHAVEYGYTDEAVADARAAGAEVLALVRSGVPPFG